MKSVAFFSFLLVAACSSQRTISAPTIGLDGVDNTKLDTSGGTGTDPTVGVVDLEIRPQTAAVGRLGTQMFAAVAMKLDGTEEDVSDSVTWSISDPAVATLAGGAASATTVGGDAQVSAALGSMSATASFSAVGLTDLLISPPTTTLFPGEQQQVGLDARYTDGSRDLIATIAEWSSDDTAVATVDNTGLVSAVAGGDTIVRGKYLGFEASITVTVLSVTSVVIEPSQAKLGAQGPLSLRALATYSDGAIADVTESAAWTSNLSGVAAISNASGTKGRATRGASVGSATITAQFSGVLATSTLRAEQTRFAYGSYPMTGGTTGQWLQFGVDTQNGDLRHLRTQDEYSAIPAGACAHPSLDVVYQATKDATAYVRARPLTLDGNFGYPGSGTFNATTCVGQKVLLATQDTLIAACDDFSGSDGLMSYKLTAIGSFTASTPASSVIFAAGTNPRALATDVSGRLLYVALPTAVRIFSIDPTTSALTELGTSPLAVSAGVAGLAVAPYTNTLYIAHTTTPGVSGYAIDSAARTLTLVSGSPFAVAPSAPPAASGIAVDPANRWLYVLNSSTSLSVFEILSGGGLSLLPGQPVSIAGADVSGVTDIDLNASGDRLYVSTSSGTTVEYAPTFSAATPPILTLAQERRFRSGTSSLTLVPTLDDYPTQFTTTSIAAVGSDGSVTKCFPDDATGSLSCGTRGTGTHGVALDFVTDMVIEPVSDFLWVQNGDPLGDDSSRLVSFSVPYEIDHNAEQTEYFSYNYPAYMGLAPNAYHMFTAFSGSPNGTLRGYTLDDTGIFYDVSDVDASATTSATMTSCAAPSAVEVDATGRGVYVFCRSDGQIRRLAITFGSGQLSLQGTTNLAAGATRWAFDPTGRFLFVFIDAASTAIDQVAVYRLYGATATLVGTSNLSASINALHLAVHPSGDYLYAIGAGSITTYPIDEDSGAIGASLGTTSLALTTTTTGVIFHPSGKYLWLGRSSGVITTHTLGSNGVPSAGANLGSGFGGSKVFKSTTTAR